MRRWAFRIALALLALLLAAGVTFGPETYRNVHVGTGYLAKQMCSCIFVAGRDTDACRPDMPKSMDDLQVTPLEDAKGVRASLFGIAERVALHHPGSGCTLY
jgi:hypothetical protein